MKAGLVVLSLLLIFCGILVPFKNVSAQEMEEYTAHISDLEFQGMIEEFMGNIVNVRSGVEIINWTVPSEKRYTAAYFGAAGGSYAWND